MAAQEREIEYLRTRSSGFLSEEIVVTSGVPSTLAGALRRGTLAAERTSATLGPVGAELFGGGGEGSRPAPGGDRRRGRGGLFVHRMVFGRARGRVKNRAI